MTIYKKRSISFLVIAVISSVLTGTVGIVIKEAFSGTTLVDQNVWGQKSYITRMKTIDTSIKPDAFICQLSTNDATMNKPLGIISASHNLKDFDNASVFI